MLVEHSEPKTVPLVGAACVRLLMSANRPAAAMFLASAKNIVTEIVVEQSVRGETTRVAVRAWDSEPAFQDSNLLRRELPKEMCTAYDRV